jgi:hypothetical protein
VTGPRSGPVETKVGHRFEGDDDTCSVDISTGVATTIPCLLPRSAHPAEERPKRDDRQDEDESQETRRAVTTPAGITEEKLQANAERFAAQFDALAAPGAQKIHDAAYVAGRESVAREIESEEIDLTELPSKVCDAIRGRATRGAGITEKVSEEDKNFAGAWMGAVLRPVDGRFELATDWTRALYSLAALLSRIRSEGGGEKPSVDPMRTRPDYNLRCDRCSAPHNLDTSIPSDVWNALVERENGDDLWSVLCTLCIDELIVEKGLIAEAEFYFVGKALKSKLYATDARQQGYRAGLEAAVGAVQEAFDLIGTGRWPAATEREVLAAIRALPVPEEK